MDTIPQYPGATLAARTKFTERFPETSRTLVYVYATEDSSEQVLASFRRQLTADGWEEHPGVKGEIEATFEKDGAEVAITGHSQILEPNYVAAEDVERLGDVSAGAQTVFSVQVNAR